MTTDNCSDCCIITPENYSKPGFIPGFGGLLLPSHSIVPSSGTLSMTGLAREKVYDNYSTSSTPTGPYSMHDLTQGGNSKGSGVSFESTNTAGSNEPNTSTPHAMSEWHGYDHDYSAQNYYATTYVDIKYLNTSTSEWVNSWPSGQYITHWSYGTNISAYSVSTQIYVGYSTVLSDQGDIKVRVATQQGATFPALVGHPANYGYNGTSSFQTVVKNGYQLVNTNFYISGSNGSQTSYTWTSGHSCETLWKWHGMYLCAEWSNPPNTTHYHNGTKSVLRKFANGNPW